MPIAAAMSAHAYDITRSYDWNYAHAPARVPDVRVPACAGDWKFCGIPVASPLGIPAGPLLNSRWILYYAALGFDVLTYKTVRSSARASYSPPNLVPVRHASIAGEGSTVVMADSVAEESWAISFGMPSKDPDVWQEDVEAARRELPEGKVLVVSVVASPQDQWTLGRIAADFARCARLARDAGAHAIEANLSCPNVATQEGNLYASPEASREIAAAVRDAAPALPIVLKVGLFNDADHAEAVVRAVTGYADAISTTNTITAVVRRPDGTAIFDGQRRGIGGRVIGARCLAELVMLRDVIDRAGSNVRLVTVGGVSSAADVRERLAMGADHVQLATAAMLNPMVGIAIREALSRSAAEHAGHATTRS
ncbi:MAG: hypothetical protein AUF76_19300 [Acidobacteria bacterium 13_1_20CM_2_65_9]|nr:MAG: hypothetical protein AUF76_19300 [Acidobacteria bacterium 13_1_20CM_2_65_9]